MRSHRVPRPAPSRATGPRPAPTPTGPRPTSTPPRQVPRLTLEDHCAAGPDWVCEACGEPWPCLAWTSLPVDSSLRRALLPSFVGLTRQAIRDLRGRPEGPEPPEIVTRFLWFLPLNDDEARATALRLR
ncbi:hypothetical protein ABGB16_27730 [Micromonospora sp. B11E3]|uniref:hypothetical protein n=1 Tax=Micromonospora sp. B11E3 TaxID=3153562 RepID=UPI00325C3780